MADDTLRAEEAQRALALAQARVAKLTPAAASVRRLRRSYGESQQDFAYRVGVSVSTVQRWEAGSELPSSLARRSLAKLEAEKPPGA